MELIYIHIDKYRNFEPGGIHLSNRFKVTYNAENQTIDIVENKDYLNIYDGNITNISAIVGKNASGKTSLLDLIGTDTQKNSFGHKYFLIYYFEKEDLFYVEKIGEEYDLKYNEKMLYKLNASENVIMLNFKNENDDFGDSKDEFRKVSGLKATSIFDKSKFLINMMRENKDKKGIYKEKAYHVFFQYTPIEDLKKSYLMCPDVLPYKEIDFDKFSYKENALLTYSCNYICHICSSLFQNMGLIKSQISAADIVDEIEQMVPTDKTSFTSLHLHCCDVLEKIIELLNDDPKYLDTYTELYDIYKDFLYSSESKININYAKNGIKLELTGKSDTADSYEFFTRFANVPLDDDYDLVNIRANRINNITFENLSDGEQANLDMFTSIDLQIREYTKDKTHYILLFDEIEQNMHPEMCRQLITDLTKFLSQYKEKTFQIIIASHSPFIISDIPKENVILLNRNESNNLVANPCEIETYGQNIHTILKNEFFMESTIGEFSKKRILKIKEKLTLENDDGVVQIKPTLTSDELSKIEREINMIGEPIIKNYLLDMLGKYRAESFNDDELIEYYEEQIKKIKDKNK